MTENESGFLSRWARRKAQARSGEAPAQPPVTQAPAAPALPEKAPALQSASAQDKPAVVPEKPPAPTMDDVALLTRESDYSRFVANGVDPGVSNAAMKKLFTDPHFNVMDRLDIYIDDYSQPDPIPPAMLRQMVQAKFLGLFDDEEEDEQAKAPPSAAAVAVPEALPISESHNPAPHENTDLQLQPDDAAGRAGAGEGAGAGKV